MNDGELIVSRTFITEENIKEFVLYVFENNLLKHDECNHFFKQILAQTRYLSWYCPHSFYSIVTNIIVNDYRGDCPLLKIFPKYIAFKNKMEMMSYEDIVFCKHVMWGVNRHHRLPLFLIEQVEYNENDVCNENMWFDFLVEENVKRYMLFLFEKQTTYHARHPLYGFIDYYCKQIDETQQTHSIYWNFCEYLKKHIDNKYYEFCLREYYGYHDFMKEQVILQKITLLWLCEKIYDSYTGDFVCERVFSDDFVAMKICCYL